VAFNLHLLLKGLGLLTKRIKAGMTEKFTFSIPVMDLAFVDAEMNWTAEPGQFVIQIGDLTTQFWVK